jgi:hypothetical protein
MRECRSTRMHLRAPRSCLRRKRTPARKGEREREGEGGRVETKTEARQRGQKRWRWRGRGRGTRAEATRRDANTLEQLIKAGRASDACAKSHAAICAKEEGGPPRAPKGSAL